MGISSEARWAHAMWRRFGPGEAPGAGDGELAIFECPASERWGEIGARACLGVASALGVAWGVGHGVAGLLAAVLGSGGLFWWAATRERARRARRVVVGDRFIEATRHGGMRVRLAWDRVGEVQHFVRGTSRDPIRVLRLVSIDRQDEVIVSDRLPEFERLMSLLEAGVRHAGRKEPSAWGRMLWPKLRPSLDARNDQAIGGARARPGS